MWVQERMALEGYHLAAAIMSDSDENYQRTRRPEGGQVWGSTTCLHGLQTPPHDILVSDKGKESSFTVEKRDTTEPK